MSSTRWTALSCLIAGTMLLLLTGGAECAEDTGPARTDLHGDPLPPGAVTRLGTARLRHFHADGLTFSKDGRRLITCSEFDGAIRIWDAASGKLVERKLFPHKPGTKERFSWVRLHPGGAMAQAYLDDKLYLYDVATGEERRRLGEYGLLSPDGKLVLSGHKLWDVAAGKF